MMLNLNRDFYPEINTKKPKQQESTKFQTTNVVVFLYQGSIAFISLKDFKQGRIYVNYGKLR